MCTYMGNDNMLRVLMRLIIAPPQLQFKVFYCNLLMLSEPETALLYPNKRDKLNPMKKAMTTNV